MSNEELALRIQAGDVACKEALWKAVRRLLWRLVRPYSGRAEALRYDMDDLIQEAYFAFEEAIQAYDPAKGFLFASYLNLQVKRSMARLLQYRNQTDYFIHAASLDAPLGDEDDSTLQDVTPDSAEAVEDTIAARMQSTELQQCMANHLTEAERGVLYCRYWQNLTLDAVGQSFGHQREWARSTEAKALRKLRRYRHEFSDAYCYRHKGLAAYKSSLSSVVEDIVIRREEIRNE